ncbi:unnamed protein product [Paramecium sonneborni]|uniref:Uncharacterized protein n=1 Tax=Paramecium sonneborni TaxID=65129 RepID=A0A8S1RIX9_9CILI|nr:unnamed protein product [Paramecium sonneborni]
MKTQSSDSKVRSYCKVPMIKQEQLLNLVFKEEWKVNQAAQLLNIKYATAKNIVLRFKKANILSQHKKLFETKRCQYRQIGESKTQINTKDVLSSDDLDQQMKKL